MYSRSTLDLPAHTLVTRLTCIELVKIRRFLQVPRRTYETEQA